MQATKYIYIEKYVYLTENFISNEEYLQFEMKEQPFPSIYSTMKWIQYLKIHLTKENK